VPLKDVTVSGLNDSPARRFFKVDNEEGFWSPSLTSAGSLTITPLPHSKKPLERNDRVLFLISGVENLTAKWVLI